MLTLSKNHNPNYVATVISLPKPRKHSNADKLQCVSVFGANVITGLSAKEGELYVYFPVESVVNYNFLSFTNSFREKTKNNDQTKVGFFEPSGRVKALKLRGESSEGYIVPWQDVAAWIQNSFGISVDTPTPSTDFDAVNGERFCWKYVIPIKETSTPSGIKNKKAKPESRIVPDQFHFHVDTVNLRKHTARLCVPYPIYITRKLHGTSAVFSNILVKPKLTWLQKILSKFGVKYPAVYDFIYSSRSVIKNDYEREHNHYYKEDIWGEAAKEFKGKIEPGITLYGEIVGYTKTGSCIQKGYDYGCKENEFKTFIYRVTLTNVNGDVFEFSWPQVVEYCLAHGFLHVPQYDANYPTNAPLSLDELSRIYLEQDCLDCKTPVPDEGICVRVDVPHKYEVYKLKSFKFLERETKMLDSGEQDTESTQGAEMNGES